MLKILIKHSKKNKELLVYTNSGNHFVYNEDGTYKESFVSSYDYYMSLKRANYNTFENEIELIKKDLFKSCEGYKGIQEVKRIKANHLFLL